LLAVQGGGSKMTTFAQGTRNELTQWQHGSRPGKVCAKHKTYTVLVHGEAQLPVDFLLVKSDVGYEWILTGHAPLVKER
jgi:hypothetical protein